MADVPRDVEFLDEGAPALPEPAGSPAPPIARRWRWVVAIGSFGVLLVAGVVARSVADNAAPSSAAVGPTRPAVGRSASRILPPPLPLPSWAPASVLRPIPTLALVPTPRCPPAGCSVLDWVADATAYALRTAFPGAQVVSQMSAFDPFGHLGASDPLVAREVEARFGRRTVIVDVVRSSSGHSVEVMPAPHMPLPGGLLRASLQASGYLIAVRIEHARSSDIESVRRLLLDPGLLAVR